MGSFLLAAKSSREEGFPECFQKMSGNNRKTSTLSKGRPLALTAGKELFFNASFLEEHSRPAT